MKKVFAVRRWNDRLDIEGIYSTRKKAESVARFLSLGVDDIEEIEINPLMEEIQRGCKRWSVVMLKNGTVKSIRPYNYLSIEKSKCFVWDRPNCDAYRGKGIPVAINATVWAVTEKEAIRITNRMRLGKIKSGELK